MKKAIIFALLLSAAAMASPVMGDETETPPQPAVSESLIVEDGMMQPMLQYSNLRDEQYSNEDSDILRFCVYVETDYDTDADGMNDLVKAFVQVPRAAVEGDYKAGTIYDPTPYGAGTASKYGDPGAADLPGVSFDYEKLSQSGERRTPAGEMSSYDAAMEADPNDWNYIVPQSPNANQGYSYSQMFDYYLVRGFAVVDCSGIGTYGSEGYELCGTTQERDSHKAVVEWITGERIAYTDPWSNIEIKADWANGKVAMTGCSYGGTLPFSVAVSGVKGLETIIPYAGIADWYDYTNSQGVSTDDDTHYADILASFVSLGTYLDEDCIVPNEEYIQWLGQIAKDQNETNGDYAPVWDMLDYTHHAEKLSCSALLVQGLNDMLVTTRNFDKMYHTFKNAGLTVKGVLYQDGHSIPWNLMVNGQLWEETVNKWLSRYLYGIDNGIEDMAELTVQSNVDGSWETYDSWGDAPYSDLSVFYDTDESVVTSSGLAKFTKQYEDEKGADLSKSNYQDDFYLSLSPKNAACYRIDIPEDTTIYGTPEVHVRLKTDDTQWDGLMISAIMIDTVDAQEEFDAYMLKDELGRRLPKKVIGKFDVGGGAGDNKIIEFVPTKTDGKCISYGWTDLCNPGMGNDSREYVRQDDIEQDKYYDYTFYMLPTSYKIQKGHHLSLVLMTWDPYRAFLDEDFNIDLDNNPEISEYDYSYTIDNTSILVRMPVAG